MTERGAVTHIPDNAVCDYFVPDPPESLIAIGWLDPEHDFPRGSVSKEFFVKLLTLLKDPWQPVVFAGVHQCELCQFSGGSRAQFDGKWIPGASWENLFVPYNGRLFVAPELIAHYIAAHRYLPPVEFFDAVLACPEMGSMGYNRALLANGGRELMRRLEAQGRGPSAD